VKHCIMVLILSIFFSSLLCAQTEREYFESGIAQLNSGKVDEAIESFRAAIQLNPAIAHFHNALGVALLKREDTLTGPMIAFQTALDLDPGFGEPYFNIGTYYAGIAKDPILALEYFERAVEVNPKLAKGYMGLGWLAVQSENAFEAVTYFERAVELDPNFKEAQYGLGLAYVAANKRGRALKSISALRRLGHEEMALKVEKIMQEGTRQVVTGGSENLDFF